MQQFDLSSLPHIPIRVIIFVVFILSSWATVASIWLGNSYLLANYFVVLLGIWAERDNTAPVPVQFLFFGMAFTFLNDILSISIVYPELPVYTSTFRFNAAMCIILIILKPMAGLFIFKEWQERNAGGGHPDTSNYEPLGGQQPPQHQGGYAAYNDKNGPPQYQPPNQPFP